MLAVSALIGFTCVSLRCIFKPCPRTLALFCVVSCGRGFVVSTLKSPVPCLFCLFESCSPLCMTFAPSWIKALVLRTCTFASLPSCAHVHTHRTCQLMQLPVHQCFITASHFTSSQKTFVVELCKAVSVFLQLNILELQRRAEVGLEKVPLMTSTNNSDSGTHLKPFFSSNL